MSSITPALERVLAFYSNFDKANLWQLPELYTADCYFQDPMHQIQGIDALMQYFEGLAEKLNYCRFEFHSRAELDNRAYISWTMHYSHPRLKKGAPLTLEGASEFRFQNRKLQWHRDYFDMGAMLYEHLPVLGGVISGIKSKVA